MALSEDQRAMLQLLLQSGQTYEDIGSLLGSDVDEVRERARAAFQEMGGEDPDREVSLTDYLLGQADPIGRADAARHLQSDPEANALAQKLAAQLRLIAPGADLPDLPAPREKRGAHSSSSAAGAEAATGASAASPGSKSRFGGAAKSGGPRRGPSTGSGLTGAQGRLIGALGAGALVVLVVVLLVTGVFGGGGDSGGSTSPAVSSGDTTGATSDSQNTSNANPTVVGAELKPVGDLDPDARGAAVFGQIKKTPVVQIGARGLEPTADGENYSIWLYQSDTAAFRLGGVRVGKSGGITAQLPVPRQVLQFISDGTFNKLDISLTKDADLKAEAKRDQKIKRLTLRHIGVSVMQGDIAGPGIGAQAAGATGATGSTGSTGATNP